MDNKDNIRKELGIDDILGGGLPDEITINDEDTVTLPSNKDKLPNYTKIKDKASKKAQRVLGSLLKFYLSEEIISNEEYVDARANLQHYELSKMIFMMETSEMAITTLMERIDGGDMQPRMFEVLATLQKTLLDVIKAQTMYMVAAEENVKKMARDIDIYKPDASASLPQVGGGSSNKGGKTSARGQKDLMKAIAEANKRRAEEQKVEEAKIDDVDDPDSENFDPGFDNENEFELDN